MLVNMYKINLFTISLFKWKAACEVETQNCRQLRKLAFVQMQIEWTKYRLSNMWQSQFSLVYVRHFRQKAEKAHGPPAEREAYRGVERSKV